MNKLIYLLPTVIIFQSMVAAGGDSFCFDDDGKITNCIGPVSLKQICVIKNESTLDCKPRLDIGEICSIASGCRCYPTTGFKKFADCSPGRLCSDRSSLNCEDYNKFITPTGVCNCGFCWCYENKADFGKSVAGSIIVDKQHGCHKSSNNKLNSLPIIYINGLCQMSSCICVGATNVLELSSYADEYKVCNGRSICAKNDNKLECIKFIQIAEVCKEERCFCEVEDVRSKYEKKK